uniref:Uncharacterized protein n=1 Tax=Glycine max TaxID=3847 RepID=A0A0R0KEX4_SOYBN
MNGMIHFFVPNLSIVGPNFDSFAIDICNRPMTQESIIHLIMDQITKVKTTIWLMEQITSFQLETNQPP